MNDNSLPERRNPVWSRRLPHDAVLDILGAVGVRFGGEYAAQPRFVGRGTEYLDAMTRFVNARADEAAAIPPEEDDTGYRRTVSANDVRHNASRRLRMTHGSDVVPTAANAQTSYTPGEGFLTDAAIDTINRFIEYQLIQDCPGISGNTGHQAS